MIYSDLTLSQKLERTEARTNADFVETRVRLDPACGAGWIEVGGAYAMFDGVESPLTQTFGLGIFEATTTEHLDEMEMFFQGSGAPVFHEVSPMADPSLMALLSGRGYRPIELTSVMYRELGAQPVDRRPRDARLSTRVVQPNEVDLWAKTSAAAWATEHESLADFMLNFGRVSAQCEGAHPYLAELDGRPIATGMLFIFDEVGMLAGASTIVDGRRLGAQTALLEDRLEFAASRGCDLAMMGAVPGSQSQRNAQKNGFNIAYTRTKWQLFD
ncbi:MAG: GNAT family N-acetyltransferase [Pyrinomonadaceae bacterium]